MDKEQLRIIFDKAKTNNKDVVMELTVPTRKDTEIIIVKNGNLDYKLDYYIKNYNSDLELERCTDVKILSAYPISWNDIKEN